MSQQKKNPKKRWKVDLTIVKDVTKIVTARTEREAIKEAKDRVLRNPRIKRKDFDKQSTQTEREP